MIVSTNHTRGCLVTLLLCLTLWPAVGTEAEVIDDFGDGNDDGWVRQANVPGSFEVIDGEYRLCSAELVTPVSWGLVAWWEDSDGDPLYSDGHVRVKFRIDSMGTGFQILLRANREPGNQWGYSFFASSELGSFGIQEFGQGAELHGFLAPDEPFRVGDDWYMEAGAVGTEISLKVWKDGSPEPQEPGMVLRDESHQQGKIIIAAMLGIEVADPRQICLAIDEVQFTPPGAGTCLLPPVHAVQAIDAGPMVGRQHDDVPTWEFDSTYDVNIALSDVRSESGECDAAGTIVITQEVPKAWAVTTASNAGEIDGTSITWMLSAADGIPENLSYQVRSDSTAGNVRFVGRISEPGSIASFEITGDDFLANTHGFSRDGFLDSWLLLGPYVQPVSFLEQPGSPGEAAIRRDHLTDGDDFSESDIEPLAGDIVFTDFDGEARSLGLAPPRGDVAPDQINPGGVPTWFEWRDKDDTINFADYYGSDSVNGVMMYAFTYINVETDMAVDIGLASDDAVQVLLDGQEIWIHNVARPDGGPNVVQDVIQAAKTPQLDPLPAGSHRIVVKVFDGAVGHSFRLRFQDPATGEPITDGLTPCLSPDAEDCGRDIRSPHFLRGDCNADGSVNISDATCALNRLFAGAAAPGCLAALNTNGDADVNIADPVALLNFLFGGGTAPVGPFPDCGPGILPADADLGCASPPDCQ